jgi:mannose-1-phosphate guanylyltransferase
MQCGIATGTPNPVAWVKARVGGGPALALHLIQKRGFRCRETARRQFASNVSNPEHISTRASYNVFKFDRNRVAIEVQLRCPMIFSDRGNRWAVVLAGGDGTRLQDLTHRISGDARPKQFCRFFEGKSLLAQTRERIAPMFPEARTLFALSGAHEPFYREELAGVPDRCAVVQPANRGTAAAMALCLRRIVRLDEDAVVAFFPSDHHYSNCAAFRESIESGLRLVEEYPGSALLLGAEPRYPEVEYGWIQPGRTLVDSRFHSLHRVSRFWEKPTSGRAEVLQRRGCLWNTFVMIGLVGAFLELLDATVPHLARSLPPDSDDLELDQAYERLATVDFSRSVLTRVPERLMVLRDNASGWTDFGSPGRVIDALIQHGIRPSWLVAESGAGLSAFVAR